jgi:hypothetical protein
VRNCCIPALLSQGPYTWTFIKYSPEDLWQPFTLPFLPTKFRSPSTYRYQPDSPWHCCSCLENSAAPAHIVTNLTALHTAVPVHKIPQPQHISLPTRQPLTLPFLPRKFRSPSIYRYQPDSPWHCRSSLQNRSTKTSCLFFKPTSGNLQLRVAGVDPASHVRAFATLQ